MKRHEPIHPGDRFGRLTVIEKAKKGARNAWRCRCECGNEDIVLDQNLKNGSVKSCGCYGREAASLRMHDMNYRHGREPRRLYETWKNMRRRCTPGGPGCEYYANRGICVCQEWMESYERFREWSLSHGYADALTIDRIDNDGNYEPSNCRWVSRLVQSNNKRTNRVIEYGGETHTMAEWSRILNVSYCAIKYRVNHGLPLV